MKLFLEFERVFRGSSDGIMPPWMPVVGGSLDVECEPSSVMQSPASVQIAVLLASVHKTDRLCFLTADMKALANTPGL